MIRKIFLGFLVLSLLGCKESTWNNPHKTDPSKNIRYSSFPIPPKTLDPAVSYSAEESPFVAQIYEPVLQYDYLSRPYKLIPETAAKMPDIVYLDKQDRPLPENTPANEVAYTRYVITIKPNIFYQPHPAFAKDPHGNLIYQHLTATDLKSLSKISDFPKTGTRELTADDYVYEIKRLASPAVNSPIAGLMSEYIIGFKDYSKNLETIIKQKKLKGDNSFLDLRQYPMAGVKLLDRYTYEITIKGKYPQFRYWLAMTFFSPIPWEADAFYAQKGMEKNNLNFTSAPVGTGPYFLAENNPNKELILQRNPNFHVEYYPATGSEADRAAGLLAPANKRLPLIDQYIFTLEKESIPRWSKFLQGYYDVSGIGSDSFEQAIRIDENGQPQLTPEMQAKKIYLQTSVSNNIWYFGFNMQDETVGGYSERARKLRQALSIAMNTEAFINIFLNGRGVPSQGPIPPGIFGYESGRVGMDPYIYDWLNNKPQRKPLTEAKKLLAEAGYPNGRDEKTGKPLIINFDITMTSAAEQKAQMDWIRQQFNKIGVQINIRATQANRFMEKMRTGNTQMFFFGWVPDYPDPENYLFLFYGPEGQVKYQGANYSNYQNPEYDKLFEQMRTMPDTPERQLLIHKMVAILQKDNPWIWGFYPKDFLLSQAWVGPAKLDSIGNNILKYQWINPNLRVQMQDQWNKPKLWPLLIFGLLCIMGLLFLFIGYRRKLQLPRIKRMS